MLQLHIHTTVDRTRDPIATRDTAIYFCESIAERFSEEGCCSGLLGVRPSSPDPASCA